MTPDEELIAAARTEYREAYNSGDVERLLRVFAPQFIDWSDGEPSFYGADSPKALRHRLTSLFARYTAKLGVMMVKITVLGNHATERGWYKLRLTDKITGEVTNSLYRYFETWIMIGAEWKINFTITNTEQPPRMLPEDETALQGSVAGSDGG
ncbi:MAG TPA: nuclear transport factor 2 family protein [Candidatus Limnocylindrales bacterium]|nr:nuclear transport factor 2 family protein [Candidatus Limnocylindrales bacterium]